AAAPGALPPLPGSAPAPVAPGGLPEAAGDGGEDRADALLRRLRELGELRRRGVLTAAEFTTAKRAVLRDR
ncbi:SHOCT domain-containing protein, partial [Streptomyces fuscigenes]|uniref:SHOCT domain-containing protein n=1 Tax=Streptomyces fuscigenes TaxID=1528880 RepID=UPI001F18DE89